MSGDGMINSTGNSIKKLAAEVGRVRFMCNAISMRNMDGLTEVQRTKLNERYIALNDDLGHLERQLTKALRDRK